MTNKISSVVADTNVVLSALIDPDSKSARALRKAGREAELLISPATSDELLSVIVRPKFDRYISLEQRITNARVYLDSPVLVPITQTISDCRDPRDNKFLELALSGHADLILTGDADLLTLHPWRAIAILSPADYLRSGNEP